MRNLTRARPWAFLGVAALAAIVATGAFAAARLARGPATGAVTRGDAQAQGQPTPGTPFADAPGTDEAAGATITAEWAKPQFAGVINGITMRSGSEGVDGPEYQCSAGLSHKNISAADGTALAIFGSVVPAGLKPDHPELPDSALATLCGDKVIAAGRVVIVTATGHAVGISTVLRPEPWNYAYGAADRVSAMTIGGLAAVVTRSIIPDGRGGSYITMVRPVADGYVITELRGENSPVNEVLAIAKELTQ